MGVLDRGVHWRHLANTIDPSVCGGDVALCQILTTSTSTERIAVTLYMLDAETAGILLKPWFYVKIKLF